MTFLKLDDFVSYKWSIILWPVWLLLLVSIICVIFSMILFVYCIYSIFKLSYSCKILIPCLWQIWITTSFSIACVYLMFEMIVWFDYTYIGDLEEGETEDTFNHTSIQVDWPAYIPILNFIGFFIMSFIYTLLIFKRLIFWFDNMLFSEDTVLNVFLSSEERR